MLPLLLRSLATSFALSLGLLVLTTPSSAQNGPAVNDVAHEQAVWLVERLWAAGVEAELLTLPGAGHGFKVKDAETAEKALLALFDKPLKKK